MFNKISGMPIPESSSNEFSSNTLCYRESFVVLVDINSQHKHIFLIIDKQQHPTPWKLATPILIEHDNINDTCIGVL